MSNNGELKGLPPLTREQRDRFQAAVTRWNKRRDLRQGIYGALACSILLAVFLWIMFHFSGSVNP